MPVRAVVACVVLGSVFCGVAALLLWLGFGQADGMPTCSGRPMRVSDVCVVDGHQLSYADMAGDSRRLHLFGRVVGLAMGAGGVVLVGAGVRGGIRRLGGMGSGGAAGLRWPGPIRRPGCISPCAAARVARRTSHRW